MRSIFMLIFFLLPIGSLATDNCNILVGATSKTMGMEDISFENYRPSVIAPELAAALEGRGYHLDARYKIERGVRKGCLLPNDALLFSYAEEESPDSGRVQLKLVSEKISAKLCDPSLRALSDPEENEDLLERNLQKWLSESSIVQNPAALARVEYKRIKAPAREYPEDAIPRMQANEAAKKSAIVKALMQLPDCR